MKKILIGAGIGIVVVSMIAYLLLLYISKKSFLDGPGMEYEAPPYESISPEEAKKLMDEETGYVILDVREKDEYEEGHVPGATLLPLGQIEEKAEDLFTDIDQMILVYCRSGRRSKLAAEKLREIGYRNIKEFGGILDWPYDIEK